MFFYLTKQSSLFIYLKAFFMNDKKENGIYFNLLKTDTSVCSATNICQFHQFYH